MLITNLRKSGQQSNNLYSSSLNISQLQCGVVSEYPTIIDIYELTSIAVTEVTESFIMAILNP